MTNITKLQAELTELLVQQLELETELNKYNSEDINTEENFDFMCSECIGLGEIEGELMFAIQAKKDEINNYAK